MLLLDINWGFLHNTILGETVSNYLLAIAIIAGALLLKKPLANLVCRIGYSIASKFSGAQSGAFFREKIQRPVEYLISTALIFVAFQQLHELLEHFVMRRQQLKSNQIAVRFGDVLDHIFLFFIIIYITWTLSRILDYIYHIERDKARRENDKARQQLLPLVKEVIKLFLWATAFLWILGAVFHANIPAIVTSLGIGGVAIALAAKETVENFFAAFTMLSDKPFETGDSIRMGTLEGKVERIGFRSTRLRSADGSAFIVPNKKLVSENIENLSNRNSRRIKFSISIKYGIGDEVLNTLIKNIKQELNATKEVLEPITVAVDTFGESAYTLSISYFLPQPMLSNTPEAVKQHVNLKVCKLISKTASPEPSTTTSVDNPEAAREEHNNNRTEEEV